MEISYLHNHIIYGEFPTKMLEDIGIEVTEAPTSKFSENVYTMTIDTTKEERLDIDLAFAIGMMVESAIANNISK